MHSGVVSGGSNTRCWPCLKRPPANSTGRLRFEWFEAFPRLLVSRTVVRSSSVVSFSCVCLLQDSVCSNTARCRELKDEMASGCETTIHSAYAVMNATIYDEE